MLIVKVYDMLWNSSLFRTSFATVYIYIEDENGNPPVFSKFVYYMEVLEMLMFQVAYCKCIALIKTLVSMQL